MAFPELGTEGLQQISDAIQALDPDGRYVVLDVEAKTVRYSGEITLHEEIGAYVGEEEPTRAFVVCWLCTEGGYNPSNLELEKRYSLGRPKVGAENDILIRRPDGTPFALIEIKPPDEFDQGQDALIEGQLFQIAPHEIGVEVLAFSTVTFTPDPQPHAITIAYDSGKDMASWVADGRPGSETLPVNYGEAVHVHLANGGERDLERGATHRQLDRLRKRMHDVLWRGSKPHNLVYEYVVKLFLAKIYDEKTTDRDSEYRFQIRFVGSTREAAEDTFDRINELYLEAHSRYLSGDGGGAATPLDRGEFSPEQTAFVVELLQTTALTASDRQSADLLGGFFEGITRDGFKQSKGLFFTHPNLSVFILSVLEVDKLGLQRIQSPANYSERLPYVMDPSCGSGTFLLTAMRLITQAVQENREGLETNQDVADFLTEKFPTSNPSLWAKDFLYGLDDSELLAMATKVNMVLHRDGNTHIYHADGLSPLSGYTDPRLNGGIEPSDSYSRPSVQSMDVLASNPPFSITLDPQTARTLEATFELFDEKNSENLFLERWYQLLKPGGRLGVVLPESFFATKENLRARMFLFDHFTIKAVVGLPRSAFQPWTPTKTTLLFAARKTEEEQERWTKTRRKYKAEAEAAQKELLAAFRKVRRERRAATRKAETPAVPDFSTWETTTGELGLTLPDPTSEHFDAEFDDFLDKTLKKFDPNRWSFVRTANELDYDFQVLNVENVGYKRTKRAEYHRKNDLFRAVKEKGDGPPIGNLNLTGSEWSIEFLLDDPEDAASRLRSLDLWS